MKSLDQGENFKLAILAFVEFSAILGQKYEKFESKT
jgi:hypothetical protein